MKTTDPTVIEADAKIDPNREYGTTQHEPTLKIVQSWVVFYGKLAYNGSWETQLEAVNFANTHPVADHYVEVALVEMFELR